MRATLDAACGEVEPAAARLRAVHRGVRAHTLTIAGLGPGTHTLGATVTDAAGLTASFRPLTFVT